MSKHADSKSLGQQELITIILEEYRTLRAEMMQRHTGFTQLFTVAATALIATIGFSIANKALLAGAIICLILMGCISIGFAILENGTHLLSARLREIEAEVNNRSGDRLLAWESASGIEEIGYRIRFNQILRRLLQRAIAKL